MTEQADLIDEKEVAEILGIKTQTLRHWRTCKTNIPYLRITGGLIRYRRSVINAWLVSKEVEVHQTTNKIAV